MSVARTASILAAATFVVVLTAVFQSSAFAAPYEGPPILQADPDSTTAGGTISVTGLGFVAHQQGVLALDGDTTGLAQYRVRGNGVFVEQVTIPDGTPLGLHTITALAPDAIASIGVSVVPAPPPATPSPAPTAPPTTASVDHVFLIVMENHAYGEVWNTSSTPYTTSFANANAIASNYYAITHPSLPNYLDLYGGSSYGITDDCSPSSSCHINAPNLADNLDAAGKTWKGYFEGMPAPCYLTDSNGYIAHHDPFIYFDDIRTDLARCTSHVVNDAALSIDLANAATTPNYALLVPDNCNNTHNCSVETGDAWLSTHIPALLSSPACTSDSCLVILTWDEDDGSDGNHVLTVFAGSAARASSVSAVHYDHFDLLRTVEDLLGVSTQTSNDANASTMADLLGGSLTTTTADPSSRPGVLHRI
jgi:hypothetical protein